MLSRCSSEEECLTPLLWTESYLLQQGQHLHFLMKMCLASLPSLLVAKELQHIWCFRCVRTILSQWTFDIWSLSGRDCLHLFHFSLSFLALFLSPFLFCLLCVWCHSMSFISHTQIPSSSQITLLKYRHYQRQTSRHPAKERERERANRQTEWESDSAVRVMGDKIWVFTLLLYSKLCSVSSFMLFSLKLAYLHSGSYFLSQCWYLMKQNLILTPDSSQKRELDNPLNEFTTELI